MRIQDKLSFGTLYSHKALQEVPYKDDFDKLMTKIKPDFKKIDRIIGSRTMLICPSRESGTFYIMPSASSDLANIPLDIKALISKAIHSNNYLKKLRSFVSTPNQVSNMKLKYLISAVERFMYDKCQDPNKIKISLNDDNSTILQRFRNIAKQYPSEGIINRFNKATGRNLNSKDFLRFH